MKNFIIVTGSAGFVGSNLVNKLLKNRSNIIIGFDDFTLGKKEYVTKFMDKKNFHFFKVDVNNINKITKIVKSFDYTNCNTFFYHLASNSDVRKSQYPKIDMEKTLLTTISSIKIFISLKMRNFIFTSSPVIYGDVKKPINKKTKTNPISNYAFAKYFSEIYIKKNLDSNKYSTWIFRFPNVVGPNLTHGILYDFNNKIKKNKSYLKVLGNGFQQKPYLYVDDIVNAISTPVKKKEFSFGLKEFNLSPRDDGIKIGKIAELFLKYKKLNIPIVYSGGERGWDGDVPKYSYDYKKNNGLKWIPKHNSISSIIKTIKKLSK